MDIGPESAPVVAAEDHKQAAQAPEWAPAMRLNLLTAESEGRFDRNVAPGQLTVYAFGPFGRPFIHISIGRYYEWRAQCDAGPWVRKVGPRRLLDALGRVRS